MISREYVAGFVDGEGCIDIRYRKTNGGRYQRFELRLTISQVSTIPLEKIKDIYGGSISPRKNGNIHYYVVSGAGAAKIISDIRPFLLVKADEADVALEFYDIIKVSKEGRYIKGKRYIQPECGDITSRKIDCFTRIREIRSNKGLKSKARKVISFV